MEIVTDASEEILATYNLVLIGPTSARGTVHGSKIAKWKLLEVAENLTDLMPEGFRVDVKEWSDE